MRYEMRRDMYMSQSQNYIRWWCGVAACSFFSICQSADTVVYGTPTQSQTSLRLPSPLFLWSKPVPCACHSHRAKPRSYAGTYMHKSRSTWSAISDAVWYSVECVKVKPDLGEMPGDLKRNGPPSRSSHRDQPGELQAWLIRATIAETVYRRCWKTETSWMRRRMRLRRRRSCLTSNVSWIDKHCSVTCFWG